MLCFSMLQYMLAFMVPSMKCSSPVPAALMQPQTMTLPSYIYIDIVAGRANDRHSGHGVRPRRDFNSTEIIK